jgi:hypothetical protein
MKQIAVRVNAALFLHGGGGGAKPKEEESSAALANETKEMR